MSSLRNLFKPEYLHNPHQVWARLRRSWRRPDECEDVLLPWKLPITIRPSEDIGRRIWAMGVFELAVGETLWRLADSGELTVDIGANIGYMTSILAAKAGMAGKVMAFEPHPDLFEEFTKNIAKWRTLPNVAQVSAAQVALSAVNGDAVLHVPTSFSSNCGVSRVGSPFDDRDRRIPIQIRRLDSLLAEGDRIGVVKIDVEGAELDVLEGARSLLVRHQIRDLVVEECLPYPTPVTSFLEECGYEIFSLRVKGSGPVLNRPDAPQPPLREWETQNFVASIDPQRVSRRMLAHGWQTLEGRA